MVRAMKDSGIEWIGEIPEGWEVDKTKHYYTNHKDIAGNRSEEFERLALTLNGVIKRPKDDSTGLQPEAFNGYQILRSGELVFKLIDLENVSTSRVGYSPFTGIVSPAYIILQPNKAEESLYGVYYFLSMWQREIFNHMGDDGVRSSLNASDLLNIPYLKVPNGEKAKIVSFLDTECVRIDMVIEQTRASIEEYKKLKQSVITQAVTKGIRPGRKMKDSGVEWIGEIAEDYELEKLKYVCEILDQYRSPITADQRNQNAEVLYDYYGASGAIDKIDGYTIDDHVMLIGEDGANLRMRNLPLMYEVNGKAWINNHAHILKPKDGMDFHYLFFTLEALDINPYITGSAQPKLSQDNLKNIWLPVPALDEQIEIAGYIKDQAIKIDALIRKKRLYLSELETYKKSLIYEYVTGKRTVT